MPYRERGNCFFFGQRIAFEIILYTGEGDDYNTGEIRMSKEFPKFLDNSNFLSQVSQRGVLEADTFIDLKKEDIPILVLNLKNKSKTVNNQAVIITCEPEVNIFGHL
ncbi:hypothetical protein NPIL_23121 [Nephila pilipes]|uniref:Uncharacterized protein n=1 Tax=Nephila pilipes TaxID=299642 RepID=A0A8X6Q4K2_NEPPI|nr:hypothetical protein NPIL_23121 [Nephila pilipes]